MVNPTRALFFQSAEHFDALPDRALAYKQLSTSWQLV